MEISELKEGSLFLDTNILLYAYTTTKFSPPCESLLELLQNGNIEGNVNSTVIDEFFHLVKKVVPDLICEDFARRDVVAVAEAPRYHHYLILIQQGLIFNHPVYMDAVCLSSGEFEGMLCLKVTVNTRRPQDYSSNVFHNVILPNRNNPDLALAEL